jgi:hypothetical protein
VDHQIQRAIDRGEIRDQAEAAGRFGLARVRLTQILDLTRLAPHLQEEILFVAAVDDVESLGERDLRGAARVTTWAEQRAAGSRTHADLCPLSFALFGSSTAKHGRPVARRDCFRSGLRRTHGVRRTATISYRPSGC